MLNRATRNTTRDTCFEITVSNIRQSRTVQRREEMQLGNVETLYREYDRLTRVGRVSRAPRVPGVPG